MTNLTVSLPAGLTLDPSSTCTQGGSLAPASNCTLVFTATNPMATSIVTIAGNNSNTINLPVTVNTVQRRVAVGSVGFLNNTPITFVSFDIGQNWQLSTTQPTGSGDLYAVSCNSSGLDCVAVGSNGAIPISYTSHDGGDSWGPQVQGNLSAGFNDVFCDSSNALQCVAISNISGGVNISVDGGQSWSLPITTPTSGMLGLSCDSTATQCTAGGAGA